MLKSYFPHTVTPHKPAFVNIRVDAVDTSFCSILPHSVIAVVSKFWFFFRVLGYH